MFLSLVHFGCQEKLYKASTYYDGVPSATLEGYESLCTHQDNISWTRMFGAGTMNLVFIIVVWYLLPHPWVGTRWGEFPCNVCRVCHVFSCMSCICPINQHNRHGLQICVSISSIWLEAIAMHDKSTLWLWQKIVLQTSGDASQCHVQSEAGGQRSLCVWWNLCS